MNVRSHFGVLLRVYTNAARNKATKNTRSWRIMRPLRPFCYHPQYRARSVDGCAPALPERIYARYITEGANATRGYLRPTSSARCLDAWRCSGNE